MARILIIEDEPDMRALLAEVLTLDGHEVFVAEDGVQGLRMLRSETPDVLLTDILMPEKDGLEVLQELHAVRTPPKIIAISWRSWSVEGLETAKDLGARKTLAKPFTCGQLIETIKAVLISD